MAELLPKDRAALAFIYELDEFKAVKKWCAAKQAKIANQMMNLDMSSPNSEKLIAMWQGQYHALNGLLSEWKKVHKQEIEKALKDKD